MILQCNIHYELYDPGVSSRSSSQRAVFIVGLLFHDKNARAKKYLLTKITAESSVRYAPTRKYEMI